MIVKTKQVVVLDEGTFNATVKLKKWFAVS